MHPVEALRARARLTQRSLSQRAGTSQPTIAAYEAGRKSPTLRTLARLAAACGLEAHVVFVRPMTREERRSLHLHAAIADKVAADPGSGISRARRSLVTMAAANHHASPLLEEWERILDGGRDRVLAVLADPSEQARELRQVTPFAGMLDAGERARIYRSFRKAKRVAA